VSKPLGNLIGELDTAASYPAFSMVDISKAQYFKVISNEYLLHEEYLSMARKTMRAPSSLHFTDAE
jgi:hypothetical protein